MKKAKVNGVEISGEAVSFELDRLVRFYMSHGMTVDEIKKNLPKLEEKALEQAIGAKLLLLRAKELGLSPDELVSKTCAGTPDPEEAEMVAFYRANKEAFGGAEFVQVQTKVRDFLRHAARSKVLAAFIAELREKAQIEYRDV